MLNSEIREQYRENLTDLCQDHPHTGPREATLATHVRKSPSPSRRLSIHVTSRIVYLGCTEESNSIKKIYAGFPAKN